MALIRRDIDGGSKGAKSSYLIPKKALTELIKLVEDEEAAFSFSSKNNHIAFMQGDQVIVSRKVQFWNDTGQSKPLLALDSAINPRDGFENVQTFVSQYKCEP